MFNYYLEGLVNSYNPGNQRIYNGHYASNVMLLDLSIPIQFNFIHIYLPSREEVRCGQRSKAFMLAATSVQLQK